MMADETSVKWSQLKILDKITLIALAVEISFAEGSQAKYENVMDSSLLSDQLFEKTVKKLEAEGLIIRETPEDMSSVLLNPTKQARELMISHFQELIKKLQAE
jgi:DNA-binding MarR family transcriptional regulator